MLNSLPHSFSPKYFLCAALPLACFSLDASAQDIVWDGGAGTELWTDADNWNPNGEPLDADFPGSYQGIDLGSGNTINYDHSNNFISGFNLTIGTGTTFYSSVQNVSNNPWRPVDILNNGTVRYDGTGGDTWTWSVQSGNGLTNNGVFESAGTGGTLFLGSDQSNMVFDNSSGSIRATNGGIVEFGSNKSTSTPKLLGGVLSTDSSSSIVVKRRNPNPASDPFANGGYFSFEDVTFNNAGTFDVEFTGTFSGGNTGSRSSVATFLGTTVVTNTGTTNVRVKEGNDDASRTFSATLTQAESADFDNQGTLHVVNNTAEDVTSAATYEITSGTATFTNSGTVRVTDNVTATGGAHSATFSTVNDFTNEGEVIVDGSGNGDADFIVSGGNDYIQTSGSTLVDSGGRLSASTLDIQGGLIGGDGGIVSGATTIGAAASLEPGNSIGTLTFESSLTLEGSYVTELDSDSLSDLLVVDGVLDLSSGVLQLEPLGGGVGLDAGTFTIASYGSLVGTFSSVVNHTGFDYSIDYAAGAGDEISVTLTAVPEPASFALLVSGVVLFSLARRQRHRK